MDINILKKYKEDGLLSMQKHPTEDLLIWNYTPVCQFERRWDEVTLMCRGLITDLEGNIKARPFKKFFNIEEHEGNLPDGEPEVMEKLDGSLGISYRKKDGSLAIATRGSFVSDQALHATELINSKYKDYIDLLSPTCTWLFEIIFPSNRVVVDYQGLDDIISLGAIDIETGSESIPCDPFKQPKIYPMSQISLEKLKSYENSQDEGFVLRWPNGFRLKFKFEEYKRLHKLLTGVTERTIWEMLKNGQSLQEILDRVPDEFYNWIIKTRDGLLKEFETIKYRCEDKLDFIQLTTFSVPEISYEGRRKDLAAQIVKLPGIDKSVVFKLLDKEDPNELIWRSLNPNSGRMFKIEM
jgi:RNA ligase